VEQVVATGVVNERAAMKNASQFFGCDANALGSFGNGFSIKFHGHKSAGVRKKEFSK
jgi:hypothetical protein